MAAVTSAHENARPQGELAWESPQVQTDEKTDPPNSMATATATSKSRTTANLTPWPPFPFWPGFITRTSKVLSSTTDQVPDGAFTCGWLDHARYLHGSSAGMECLPKQWSSRAERYGTEPGITSVLHTTTRLVLPNYGWTRGCLWWRVLDDSDWLRTIQSELVRVVVTNGTSREGFSVCKSTVVR